MATPAQIAANQANAKLSTGPSSEAGRTKSSLNAVKSGLTGRTALLPSDDVAAYQAHVSHFMDRYQPSGEEECNLVQSLADTEWRLMRIPSLEMGIYAVGHVEFAELFADEDEAVRKHLIEAKTFIAYQRQLSNLSTQEARLRRQREKDSVRLQEMQEKRRRHDGERLTEAVKLYIQAVHAGTGDLWHPASFGFEFSLAQIEVCALELEPDLFAGYYRKLSEAAA